MDPGALGSPPSPPTEPRLQPQPGDLARLQEPAPEGERGRCGELGQRGSCRGSGVGDMQGHCPVRTRQVPSRPGPCSSGRRGDRDTGRDKPSTGGNPLSRSRDTGRGDTPWGQHLCLYPCHAHSLCSASWLQGHPRVGIFPLRASRALLGSTVRPWELAGGCLLPMAPGVALPMGVAY